MADLLFRHRWRFLMVLVSFVLALAFFVPRALIPDNSIKVWFVKSDPSLAQYQEFHNKFGNDEVILLEVELPSLVSSQKGLSALKNLDSEILKIKGVASVLSIASANDLIDSENGLEIVPVVRHPLPSDEELKNIAIQWSKNNLLIGRLISKDMRYAMLWIQMSVAESFDSQRDSIVANVREKAQLVLGETHFAMAGTGVIYSALNIITQQDFTRFMGLGYALTILVLCWIFRHWLLITASVAVIACGSIAGLGCYGLMGHQINMVTVMLPTLTIVLGIASAIHFPLAYVRIRKENYEQSAIWAAKEAVNETMVPCFLTTATTIVGFLSLIYSPMAVIKELGIYASIGLGVAYLSSMIIMMVVCVSLKENIKLPDFPLIVRFLDWCRECALARPYSCAFLSAAFTIAGFIGWSMVEVDTDTLSYLPENSVAVRDHRWIEKTWGAYGVLDYVLTPVGGVSASDAHMVAMGHEFADRAKRVAGINHGFSIYDFYERAADVLGMNRLGGELSTADLAQLQLLLDVEENRALFAPFISADNTQSRVMLVGPISSARTIQSNLVSLQSVANSIVGQEATISPAGYPPMYVKIVDYIVSSQVQGFGGAVVMIFMLMWLWLRSLRLALISLIPNLFPVVIMMGVMGALNIRLDAATAMVAAIIIGVSVDDTVHLLHYYNKHLSAGHDFATVMRKTFQDAGPPAVTTTIVLLVGYPVLMLAQVKTVYYFGLLTTISAVAALFGDLIILPLLLKMFGQKQSVEEFVIPAGAGA